MQQGDFSRKIAKKRYHPLALWTFRYYLDASGSQLRATYDAGSKELRARLQSRLRTLANLPFAEWNENYRKALKGECAGLDEIRFKADNVQQRPLGYRSGDAEFTFLYWATEKGNKFVPPSACDKALTLKAAVESDRTLTDALWFVIE